MSRDTIPSLLPVQVPVQGIVVQVGKGRVGRQVGQSMPGRGVDGEPRSVGEAGQVIGMDRRPFQYRGLFQKPARRIGTAAGGSAGYGVRQDPSWSGCDSGKIGTALIRNVSFNARGSASSNPIGLRDQGVGRDGRGYRAFDHADNPDDVKIHALSAGEAGDKNTPASGAKRTGGVLQGFMDGLSELRQGGGGAKGIGGFEFVEGAANFIQSGVIVINGIPVQIVVEEFTGPFRERLPITAFCGRFQLCAEVFHEIAEHPGRRGVVAKDSGAGLGSFVFGEQASNFLFLGPGIAIKSVRPLVETTYNSSPARQGVPSARDGVGRKSDGTSGEPGHNICA